ncbi:hypothetical protein GCM10028792_16400 [Salinisphaera aquimarina]
MQGLWVAHAFDHPIHLAHADPACLTCAHGHPGNAPPSGISIRLLTQPGITAPAAVITTVWWSRPLRVYHGRAPPVSRV